MWIARLALCRRFLHHTHAEYGLAWIEQSDDRSQPSRHLARQVAASPAKDWLRTRRSS
jgi:hypothetical protein